MIVAAFGILSVIGAVFLRIAVAIDCNRRRENRNK